MNTISSEVPRLWRLGLGNWVVLGAIVGLLALIYWDALVELERLWGERQEYSHGYLIPVIAAFLLWQNKSELSRTAFTGSWWGVLVFLFGIVMFIMGELAALYVIQNYSLIVVLGGLALALTGWKGVRLWWAPLLLLLFMVPLPSILHNNLSGKLQLISSEYGVAIIRFFDISVYLEGNVIDLGTYQLQVVEACNGLRYLFPLMSFGFLMPSDAAIRLKDLSGVVSKSSYLTMQKTGSSSGTFVQLETLKFHELMKLTTLLSVSSSAESSSRIKSIV